MSKPEPVQLYVEDDRRALIGAAAQITERIEREVEILANGKIGVESFDQYQRRCGKVEGLREALDIFKDLAQKAK